MADEPNPGTPAEGVAFLKRLQYPPKYTLVEIDLGGTEHDPQPPRFLALHHEFTGSLLQFGRWLKERVEDCEQAGGWVRDIKVGGGGSGIKQYSVTWNPLDKWHAFVTFLVEDRVAAQEREYAWNDAFAEFFRSRTPENESAK